MNRREFVGCVFGVVAARVVVEEFPERGARVYFAAVTKDQAKQIHRMASQRHRRQPISRQFAADFERFQQRVQAAEAKLREGLSALVAR